MREQRPVPNSVVVRDLIIFWLKLWLDGLKDVALFPLAAVAAGIDLLSGPSSKGYRMYRVMRRGERFDLWLNLYGAAEHAERSREGLFGGSEPGDGTMLGELEGLGAERRATGAGRDAERQARGS